MDEKVLWERSGLSSLLKIEQWCLRDREHEHFSELSLSIDPIDHTP